MNSNAASVSERASLFDDLRDRMDAVGPPWGNSKLLASVVEDGFDAAYEALARGERLEAALRYMADYQMTGTEMTLHIDFQGKAREALDG